MNKDLTRGHPAKLIILFTIPLLIGNLFQQFYSMADTFIVGRTLGLHALAAVGCTGSLMFLIVGFVFGFSAGTAIITSQRFGAGDLSGVRRSFATSIILGAAVALFLSVFGTLMSKTLLQWMQTPPEIIEDANAYTFIIFAGVGATMLFNVFANALRAVGNSRAPLIFLVIACLLNIVLDYTFILVFHLGVAGAAYATVLAQLISGLLCLPYILKKGSVFRLTKDDWKIARQDLWIHLRTGLPMGFQLVIIASGAIVLQFALNGLGPIAVGAFAAAQRIDQMATMPLISFGITMATYTAQNYGAGKFDRIRSGIWQCVAISLTISVVMGVIMVVFGRFFSSFFIVSDQEALALSHRFLTINGCAYCVLAMIFIFRNTLQGLGKTAIPTFAGFMELVMRVFGALVLTEYFGFTGVCISTPLAWIGAAVPLMIAFFCTMTQYNHKFIDTPVATNPVALEPGRC